MIISECMMVTWKAESTQKEKLTINRLINIAVFRL